VPVSVQNRHRLLGVDQGLFMNEAKHNVWRVLALALGACAFICLGLWIYLLSTICSSPGVPNPITGNVLAYNCHGSIVFISLTQRILLFGLIPALAIFGLCGKAARKRAEALPGRGTVKIAARNGG
jgi:hypothetical protein